MIISDNPCVYKACMGLILDVVKVIYIIYMYLKDTTCFKM